jgi:hypothetical protein
MRGTFGQLDAQHAERMRHALVETICAHYASPPFFDSRAGTERVRPLDRASLEAVGNFVHSINFSPLQATDIASNEVRRFFEALLLRYLDVNPAFKAARYGRYVPALRTRAPRLAADLHRGLLTFLDGKAPGFGAPARKHSWTEGRERARKISQEDYERTTRILEAAMIRSRIDDYSEIGFVPQSAPADVARPPERTPARPEHPAQPAADQWLNGTAGDLTVPAPASGFAATFDALGISATSARSAPAAPPANNGRRITNDQPTSPMPASVPPRSMPSAPRELPNDLYELYGDYLQDMQPDTAVRPVIPAVSARPVPPVAPPPNPPAQRTPWQSGQGAPPFAPPQAVPAPYVPHAHQQPMNGPTAGPATHADQMVFWQLRYQLEAYVRRAAESYGLSFNGSDPSTVLDALRQSGFVDEADLRIAEGILALTDRVTRANTVAVEDYRQAFLLYLLYHRSHLGV